MLGGECLCSNSGSFLIAKAQILSTWADQDWLHEIVTTRYFKLCVKLTGVLLIVCWYSRGFFLLFIHMNTVLSELSVVLHRLHHGRAYSRLSLRETWSLTFVILLNSKQSSANRWKYSSWCIQAVISFIQMRNSSGPGMLPCGTPEIMGSESEW